MSVKPYAIRHWAWEAGVKGNLKWVLLALAEHGGEDGDTDEVVCFPSLKTLSEMTDLSERTVMRCTQRLEELGLITVTGRARADGRGRTSNRYTLHTDVDLSDRLSPKSGDDLSDKIDDLSDKNADLSDRAVRKTSQNPKNPKNPPPNPPQGEQPVLMLVEVEQPKTRDRFEEFWKAYPRRDAKIPARKAWDKAIKRHADPDVIMAGLANYLPIWAARDKQFTPLPSTWLNGERWNDETAAKPADDYEDYKWWQA